MAAKKATAPGISPKRSGLIKHSSFNNATKHSMNLDISAGSGSRQIPPLKKRYVSTRRKRRRRRSLFLGSLTDLTATNPQAPAENEPGRGSTAVSKTIPITPEQRARGRRGEDEMKRRLLLPNGWSGLRLLQDVRAQNCGFDFLCVHCEREIELEVKTFTHQG